MATITVKQELHLHQKQYEMDGYDIFATDMSEYGHVHITSVIVDMEFNIPEGYNKTTAKIDQLKSEKQRIQAEAHLKAENIEEQIQSLLCIEDQSEG